MYKVPISAGHDICTIKKMKGNMLKYTYSPFILLKRKSS